MIGRQGRWTPGREARVLPLAFFCLLGVCVGQVLALFLPDSVERELYRYVTAYRPEDAVLLSAAARTVAAYFAYPALALALSSLPRGLPFLYGEAAVMGFVRGFTAACFAGAFGSGGAALAGAVLGIRCAVTVPCFFLAASLGAPRHRGRPVRVPRDKLAAIALALLGGALAEVALVPSLIRLALAAVGA